MDSEVGGMYVGLVSLMILLCEVLTGILVEGVGMDVGGEF